MPLRVVLVGRGPLFRGLHAGLVRSSHTLLGTVGPDRMAGVPHLGRRLVASRAARGRLLAAAPDLVLVGSWGEVLDADLLGLPRLGCLNCHPSLLPAHRGPNPYLSAIVCGDTVSGVSFHRMIGRLDAGPLLARYAVAVVPDDTGGALRARLVALAAERVADVLDGLEEGTLQELPQNESAASTFSIPGESDLWLRWERASHRLHDRIRGVRPWYLCRTSRGEMVWEIGGSSLYAVRSTGLPPGTVLETRPEGPVVATGTPDRALLLRDVRRVGGWRRRAWPAAGERLGR